RYLTPGAPRGRQGREPNSFIARRDRRVQASRARARVGGLTFRKKATGHCELRRRGGRHDAPRAHRAAENNSRKTGARRRWTNQTDGALRTPLLEVRQKRRASVVDARRLGQSAALYQRQAYISDALGIIDRSDCERE